jgi:hypothetical protein
MKTIDLKVRPIHHHLEPRVRAHIFLPGLVPSLAGVGCSPADFQVALLPPIPAMRSLSPHRGIPG